ncbi:MAG TPA: DUF2127 domain-containing protein [Fimbriimonadaceae bacterium]|nr:DUF2127 domain-containing protein [Fimbriimonadaceae bacterium]
MTDIIFRISLIIKGLDAILESLAGILLLMPFQVSRLISFLLQHELAMEAKHHTAAHFEHAAAVALQHATTMGAIYLIFHGVAKVVLIAAVFKEQRWGYLGLFAVLSLFALLELSRGVMTGQFLDYAFAGFDLFIVYLIAKEYKMHFIPAQNAKPIPGGSKPAAD